MAFVRVNMLQKHLVLFFTTRMPLRNSRSGLYLHLPSLKQMEGQDLQHHLKRSTVRSPAVMLKAALEGRPAERAFVVHKAEGEQGPLEGAVRAQSQATGNTASCREAVAAPRRE